MNREKLSAMENRCMSLEDQLSDPAVMADQNRWRALSKEHADLLETVTVYREWKKREAEEKEAEEVLADPDQIELHDLAREDLAAAKKKKEELEEELHRLLIPKDPMDGRNVILEIRAGTGGEEAALFAGDLLRMYLRLSEKKGWKAEIVSESETDLGGVKEVSCIIEGKDAYSTLKYESGVHRVQRVPVTESAGRIHTSAVTVAVMPQAEDVDVPLDMKDIRIDVYHSSGAGGQKVNKTATAIRLTHIPTGTVVTCQNERSQLQNKEKAFQILRSRLYEDARQKKEAEEAADRKSQVGSGDRSERIRTYNFPQGRVTDHRIPLTLYQLDAFLNGDMDGILKPLVEMGAKEREQEASHG